MGQANSESGGELQKTTEYQSRTPTLHSSHFISLDDTDLKLSPRSSAACDNRRPTRPAPSSSPRGPRPYPRQRPRPTTEPSLLELEWWAPRDEIGQSDLSRRHLEQAVNNTPPSRHPCQGKDYTAPGQQSSVPSFSPVELLACTKYSSEHLSTAQGEGKQGLGIADTSLRPSGLPVMVDDRYWRCHVEPHRPIVACMPSRTIRYRGPFASSSRPRCLTAARRPQTCDSSC